MVFDLLFAGTIALKRLASLHLFCVSVTWEVVTGWKKKVGWLFIFSRDLKVDGVLSTNELSRL